MDGLGAGACLRPRLDRRRRRHRAPRQLRRRRRCSTSTRSASRARCGASTPGRSEALGRPCVPIARRPARRRSTRWWSRSPPPASPDAIEQAGARGCGGAVVFSAGFARGAVGRGAARRALIAAAAAPPAAGVRPQLQRDRRAARARRAVGRRAASRTSRATSRSSPRAATSRSTRWPRGAGCASTRSSRRGNQAVLVGRRLPRAAGRDEDVALDRAVPGGRRRRRRGCATRWRRAPRPACRSWC